MVLLSDYHDRDLCQVCSIGTYIIDTVNVRV